ncbi:MAG: DUF2269 family protein [Gemmatimonadaceae bacterium]|jgi:uncharacterized membrane protein
MNWYGVLKYIHVLSVVIWLGGLTGLVIALWKVAREKDRALLAVFLKQTLAYAQGVAGPAAGFVLLTGLTMVWLGNIGYNTFWVWFGYAGVLVQGVFGGLVIRKRAIELLALTSEQSAEEAALAVAFQRLRNAQLIYLILFAIIIAGMVIKPTL